MKTVYLIGGTMGVGKTAVCHELTGLLERNIFLDGDWCWNATPFVVTEETKHMVLENICFLLNQFIRCPAYEHVIFCWVMHEQSIIESILSGLERKNCKVCVISLVCSEQTLRARLTKDVAAGTRTEDVIERSVSRILRYQELNSIKINTDNRTIREIAEEIANL